MSDANLDPSVVDAALDWYVTLSSGVATEADQTAFVHWRQSCEEHDQAWRRLVSLGQTVRSGTRFISPDTIRDTLHNTEARLQNRRQVLKTLMLAGFAVPAACLVSGQTSVSHLLADYRTSVGERKTLDLADGTRLWMNTDTAVDVVMNAQQRRIALLHGEIQIETARDTRPFVVNTVDGTVRPIGTRFIVRRLDSEENTLVAVSEGAVEVQTKMTGVQPTRVKTGETLRFTITEIYKPITSLYESTQSQAFNAWTDGMLSAERMRLGDFLHELARYRPGLLRCDPAVADLRLTGTYPLDNTDLILAKLEETLPVSINYRTRYWVTVTAFQ